MMGRGRSLRGKPLASVAAAPMPSRRRGSPTRAALTTSRSSSFTPSFIAAAVTMCDTDSPSNSGTQIDETAPLGDPEDSFANPRRGSDQGLLIRQYSPGAARRPAPARVTHQLPDDLEENTKPLPSDLLCLNSRLGK